MQKSQTSMEFLFLIVIAFMVSLIFTAVSLEQQNEINFQKEYLLLKDLGLKIQGEILLAANVEDGYSRKFNIPAKLENFDYDIIISNYTLLAVESKNHLFAVRIPSVNGTIIKGNNLITKNNGNIKIN